jgi:hypothetical protein
MKGPIGGGFEEPLAGAVITGGRVEEETEEVTIVEGAREEWMLTPGERKPFGGDNQIQIQKLHN